MPHTIRLTKLNLRVKKRKAGRPTPKKNNERATTQNNQAGKEPLPSRELCPDEEKDREEPYCDEALPEHTRCGNERWHVRIGHLGYQ